MKINIDDTLLEEASRFTGVTEKSVLVHQGLQALIQKHAARRLSELGGTEEKIKAPRRRRPAC